MSIINAKIDEIAEGYVNEAKTDYVGLWQICIRVRKEFNSTNPQQLRELVFQVIRRMLASGLQAVTLHSSGPGCTPWNEQETDEVIKRISSEWDALGHDPSVADIVWFNNPSG
ncbi:MAG TPA: hypothetical protein VFB54_04415 [Burkholderiales bacterium]|nr:hypothetical protein [Burkholderiales bacterium]